jgi:hypothetical protein
LRESTNLAVHLFHDLQSIEIEWLGLLVLALLFQNESARGGIKSAGVSTTGRRGQGKGTGTQGS